MEKTNDVEKIKQMLSAGHLTIPDPSTGYQRAIYAHCPRDRHDSAIYRIERSGEAISRVVFICPICSKHFDTLPEEMFLR